jgi:hypothetical protein
VVDRRKIPRAQKLSQLASVDVVALVALFQQGIPQDPNTGSLDQATADLVQALRQSNPALRVAGDAQNIGVNGLQGRAVSLIGVSPVQHNGEALRERDWLVTVARPQGGLLYLVFIAPDEDFGELRPTYERMLDSLQVR